MPVEWTLGIVTPIVKGNSDIRNCSCYGSVWLLDNGMKVVSVSVSVYYWKLPYY